LLYSQTQWVLLFYFYCIAGWIWETPYVSLRRRQWINRGFLHGPWLPIYGTGAIVILFTTRPVIEYNILVFLVGMISATLLEFATGAAMERIFNMRYWDYSQVPFNLNGYICLKVSIAWGFFSLFLVRILHPPVESAVLSLPNDIAYPLSIALIILFTVDATKSIQSALGLKDLLVRLTASNELLSRLENAFDSLSEKIEEGSSGFRANVQQLGTIRAVKTSAVQRLREENAKNRKDAFLHRLAEHRDRKSTILSSVREKAGAALLEIEKQLQRAETPQEHTRLEKIKNALSEIQASAHKAEVEMAARRNRDFQRAVSILNRNPSAKSQKYQQAFSELIRLKAERPSKEKQK